MGNEGPGESQVVHGPAWESTVLLLVPPNDVDEVHQSVDDFWNLNADLGDWERCGLRPRWSSSRGTSSSTLTGLSGCCAS